MDSSRMQELVDSHMSAENQGDIDGAVAVYTDDVEHDWDVVRQHLGDDAMVLEQLMTGTVIGSMFGVTGKGRRISFRMLHVFEFRDGLISRENIWLDTAAVIDQLS